MVVKPLFVPQKPAQCAVGIEVGADDLAAVVDPDEPFLDPRPGDRWW